MSIEQFLGLDEEDIKERVLHVLEHIPTYPGTKYIEQRLKEFQIQPWPFIIYLAHYDPERLEYELSCYRDYDGAENSTVVIEKLREYYIFSHISYEAYKHEASKHKK